MTSRRRFLTISAGAALAFACPARATQTLHIWKGTAMGSAATIRLAHPQAEAIATRAQAEIDRLEDIFSLYRPHSSLARLNTQGALDAPPFDLLECLTLAASVHQATQGRFDPTIQRLWQMQAEAAAANRSPTAQDYAQALALTGWHRVTLDDTRITMKKGTALTLNGIAQGYVADRVARLLQSEGLTNILIDTGELRALGPRPDGTPWPVRLQNGATLPLATRALATSSPRGTVLDDAGTIGHILDPQTGHPAAPRWQAVTISAPSAALADALSTAACLMPDEATIKATLTRFPDTNLEAALA